MTDEVQALDGAAKGDAGASARAPKSAVSGATGFVGIGGLLIAASVATATGMSPSAGAVLCLAGVAVPMIVWAILVERTYRNPTTEMDLTKPRPLAETIATTRVKLIGLWATWIVIAGFYAALRHYDRPQYGFYFELLEFAVIPLVVLSIAYVFLIDRYMINPRDSLWHAGQWIVTRGRADKEMVKEHARCWAIKAFFLPYMFTAVRAPLQRLNVDVDLDPVAVAAFSINLCLIVEIYFCTVGYILTVRPLDSHIRSANPFVAGWVAALICYPPFSLTFKGGPLDYQSSSPKWSEILGGSETLLALWAALLIATSVFWAWSTLVYGMRWSNLTNRGIITHGPYRYFRHPDYLAKNIRWWLLYLPFLSFGSEWVALQNTALLLVVNLIYYFRAKTEERHLSEDPQYQAYSAWIDQNGVIPKARRWLGSRVKLLSA